jgi:RHS repeat-associated protein
MAYDIAGHLTKRQPPVGGAESWTYDTAGNVASHTDGGNHTTTFAYNGLNELTGITDPLGSVRSITYTGTGQIATVATPLGTASYGYDAAGDEISIASPLGEKTTRTFDASGRMLTQVDPRGNVAGATPASYTWTFTYDASDRITSSKDPRGHTTKYGYDAAGDRITVTDALGHVTTTGYDAANHPVSVKDAIGNTATSVFDGDGNLIAFTDPTGGKTVVGYDKADRRISTVSPRGNATGATASTYTWQYTYDADDRLASTVDPTSLTSTRAYDDGGRITGTTDPLGHTATRGYDSAGNVTSTIDAAGGHAAFGYDAGNRMTSRTDPDGNTTTFAYDSVVNLTAQTTPLGEKTSYTYDADGRRSTAVDPRGNAPGANAAAYTTTYAYNADNDLISVTDALKHVTKYSYDSAGRRTKVTDPAGAATAFAYDAANRLTAVTAPDGGTTTYVYDAANRLTSQTDANGHATTIKYDAASRVINHTDPLGHAVGFGYDPDGNRTSTTNARGQTATTTVDPRGLITGIGYSDGTAAIGYTRDAAGRVTGISDTTGTRTLGYDNANRLTSSTVPGTTNPLRYTYDAAGLLTARSYPDGTALSYGHDADGQTTSMTAEPQSAISYYGYDQAGNLTSTMLAGSGTANPTYTTVAGAAADWPLTEGTGTTAVDKSGNNNTGTLAAGAGWTTGGATFAGVYGGGSIKTAGPVLDTTKSFSVSLWANPQELWLYETLLTQNGDSIYGFKLEIQQYNRGHWSFSRSNDPHYAPAMAQSLDGAKAGVWTHLVGTYDAATGRISLYVNGQREGTDSNPNPVNATGAMQMGQDANGGSPYRGAIADVQVFQRVLGQAEIDTLYSKAQRTTRTYDQAGHLSAVNDTGPGGAVTNAWQLTRDADGRPVTANATGAGGTTWQQNYGYDISGRVISSCTSPTGQTGCPSGSQQATYTYDKVGNRTTATINGAPTTYTYDNADDLTGTVSAGTTVPYTYDADGNRTSDGTSTSTYNAVAKLTSTTAAGSTYGYTYDDLGNLSAVTKNGTLDRSLTWDPNNPLPQLVTEAGPGGAKLADYQYDPNGTIQAQNTPTGNYYTHTDWLGSVTDLTNDQGTDQIRYSYDAYGIQTATPVAATPPTNPFGYTGQYQSPYVPGLIDLRARNYSSATGTFTTRDPVASALSEPAQSRYAYAHNQPTALTDPSGACPWCVGAIIGGVVGGVSYTAGHWNDEDFSLGGLAQASAEGAVIGAGAGWLMPAAGTAAVDLLGLDGADALLARMGVNGGVGSAYDYLLNKLQCRPTSPKELLAAALTGGILPEIAGPASNAASRALSAGKRAIKSVDWADDSGAISLPHPIRSVNELTYKAKRLLNVPIAWMDNRALGRSLDGVAPEPNATVRDLLDLAPGNPQRPAKLVSGTGRSDADVLKSVFAPTDGQFIATNENMPNVILQGNHRAYQLLQRAADPENTNITFDTPIFVNRGDAH